MIENDGMRIEKLWSITGENPILVVGPFKAVAFSPQSIVNLAATYRHGLNVV